MLMVTTGFCGEWTGTYYVRAIENEVDGNVFVTVTNTDGTPSSTHFISTVTPAVGSNHLNMLLAAMTNNRPVRFYVTNTPNPYYQFTYMAIGPVTGSFGW